MASKEGQLNMRHNRSVTTFIAESPCEPVIALAEKIVHKILAAAISTRNIKLNTLNV
jgi:hypothetical protein